MGITSAFEPRRSLRCGRLVGAAHAIERGMRMSLHGVALFLHVVLAILLVGGSFWADVAGHRLRAARSVGEARAHAEAMQAFVKASMPLAIGVLLAGAYLATVSSMWTHPWLIASLALFLAVGALAGSAVDPAVAAAIESLDAAPDGPVPAQVAALAHAPGLTTVTSLLAGADAALVFLMTNKPGLAGSVVTVVLGLALGVALGMRERRPPAPAAT